MKSSFYSATRTTIFLALFAAFTFPAYAQQTAVMALQSGIDVAALSPTIRIQDDFYRHVNGAWSDKTEIPADKSRWGAFDELREASLTQVRAIIDGAVKRPGAVGSEPRKIADLYASFIDQKARDALGTKPLKLDLAKIAAVKDKQQLAALLAYFNRTGVEAPFGIGVYQDAKDTNRYAVYASQSGLGLPDRDYYLKDDDAKLKDARAKYLKHVEAMLAMSGDKDAAAHAQAIVELETQIAKIQWTKVETRNAVKSYNRVEVEQLAKLAPGFDWNAYLKEAGVAGKSDALIMRQPSYFTGFAALFDSVPLETWKQYFNWHVLEAYAPYLDTASVNERFAFSGTTLRGVPQNEPQWQLAVRTTDTALSEAVGKLYVAKYFPPENKARMLSLVNNLLASFRTGIAALDWMGPATKKEAQAKLATFKPYIGYPDKWRDYSALKIQRDDLVGNIRRSRSFVYQRVIDRLGQPVDRDEWSMSPQTVNATYSPLRNAITFPAAILQPPFFNAKADDAVNYGAIGAVIGHEISHGFDDQGSQYDGQGNLRDWWTREDRSGFAVKAAQLVKQYGAYSPVSGYFVNGELTLGENIGDNSGLAIAYKAYQVSLGGKPSSVIDGFTGEQRFFLGFGQVWRGKLREQAAIVQIKTDPHSPSQFRGNGTVLNQPGFYSAFDIKETDKMYLPPSQRIIMW